MEKHRKIYEGGIYFGPDGTEKGRGYGITTNGPLGSTYTLGGNYGIYDEPDPYDVDELDLDDIDGIDIGPKIDGDLNQYSKDLGAKGNRLSSFSGGLTNLAEFSDHTNTVMQGSNPNLTYRGSKGQKATKTSMSSTTYPKLYTGPRVDMTATQYGSSRAPLPRHDQETSNIYSLDDILDKHERALFKHNNRVRKLINELNYNFYDI
jgi:hypothetical protein